MARAISSLPVPVSPLTRTVEDVAATSSTCSSTRARAALRPMMSGVRDSPIDLFPEKQVLRLQLRFQLPQLFQRLPQRFFGFLLLGDVNGVAEPMDVFAVAFFSREMARLCNQRQPPRPSDRR